MNRDELERELERLHPASFGWALWCCRQRYEDAEEVLQTAYVKVLEGRAKFAGESSFRTWLFGVVRYTATEQARRRWLRDALLLKWFAREPAPPPFDPEAAIQESARRRELRQALNALPQRQREVLHLVFYQEMTVEEAARAMDVSVGTARTHFERGKSRLREMLAREEEHEFNRS
jgi:RNA polymerase sigma-70 factor (ECF subfamily)